MSKTYRAVDAERRPVEYRDRKRWWWLLSVVYPLLPFTGIAAHAASGEQLALGLPILLPFEISPLTAAALGISLNSAAFSAEIFRGGIESIDRSQAEAARALGMTAAQAMRRVVLPQALRRMVPALTNRGIEIFKMTTLASAVAYVELLQQGKLLASLNFNPIETYTVIAIVFFLCLLPMVQATYALERRLGRSDA